MAKDFLDPLHKGASQSRAQAVIFIVLLVAGGLSSLTTKAARTAPEDADFLHGEWTARWEHEFDEALPSRDFGIATWGALEWFGFRTARRGALVGSDGFLFTSEEFEALPDEEAEVEAKVAFIRRVHGLLEAQRIDLVVALVPAKARTCDDKLGRYPLHAPGRYAAVRSALVDGRVRVPDLEAALDASDCATTFLRTDTHWTPDGARIAADALVADLRAAGIAGGLPSKAFDTQPGAPVEHSGDLLNYLRLGVLQEYGPAPDELVPQETSEVQGAGEDLSAALFGDAGAPMVALVGTSYSFNPLWNFSGALKQGLQADVLNVAEEGGGPFAPMRTYLGGPEITDAPPLLVIWEIPERYLAVAYDLTLPGDEE